mmetsp:Transcript_133176/g.385301  ORF Transcript_133176/g.385301 Transcript_133176/m.385301 type:complete len:210 (-) Transcript_133176:57-686(-)
MEASPRGTGRRPRDLRCGRRRPTVAGGPLGLPAPPPRRPAGTTSGGRGTRPPLRPPPCHRRTAHEGGDCEDPGRRLREGRGAIVEGGVPGLLGGRRRVHHRARRHHVELVGHGRFRRRHVGDVGRAGAFVVTAGVATSEVGGCVRPQGLQRMRSFLTLTTAGDRGFSLPRDMEAGFLPRRRVSAPFSVSLLLLLHMPGSPGPSPPSHLF